MAVIVSLIFLVHWVCTNTRVLKATAGTNIQQSWVQVNQFTSEHSCVEAWVRVFDPGERSGAFSEEEKLRIGFLARALLLNFEAEYFQYASGVLDPRMWEQHRSWCHSVLRLPVWQVWWSEERTNGVYTEELVQNIESAPAAPSVTHPRVGDPERESFQRSRSAMRFAATSLR